MHICTRKVTQESVNQLVKCTLIKTVNFLISECTCKIVPNGILHFQCRSHNAAIPFYDLPGKTVLAFPWIWEYIFNYLTFQPLSFLLLLPLFWLFHSAKVKIKGKVVPTHPMKSHSGKWSIAPLLLKVSTIRRWAVSLKTWQLHPQVKAFVMLEGTGWRRCKHLATLGIQNPDHPVHSLVTVLTTLFWHPFTVKKKSISRCFVAKQLFHATTNIHTRWQ